MTRTISSTSSTSTTHGTPAAGHGGDEPRPVVAIAWPTGCPIYAYTAEELAASVDVYTRALRARAVRRLGGGDA